jgi:hypothetical protein
MCRVYVWIYHTIRMDLVVDDGKKRLLIYSSQTQLLIVEENIRYM